MLNEVSCSCLVIAMVILLFTVVVMLFEIVFICSYILLYKIFLITMKTMDSDFNPEDWQGRMANQVESSYKAIGWGFLLFLGLLLTALIVNCVN